MKPWLFSRRMDLLVFGGTAAIALLLVALAPWIGAPGKDAPRWTWITGVLLVDVAHVWSTVFVVYLDPIERARRPFFYRVVPLACFAFGVVVFMLGGLPLFWRCIAYLAVFHFVRQQYGWVMMYRARAGERAYRWLDTATIYATTIYPLLVWHAAPPRDFQWMREGDFVIGLPPIVATIAGYAYVALLAAYVARAIVVRNWGKHLVVGTTAACWYVGIVATNSDYAFTVTNVFIHGIPYMALVYIYARNAGSRLLARGPWIFLGTLWLIAYVEELGWGHAGGDWEWIVAPLLATPQLAHYVLDGFLWSKKRNPRIAQLL